MLCLLWNIYGYQGACQNMRVLESNSCSSRITSERLRDFSFTEDLPAWHLIYLVHGLNHLSVITLKLVDSWYEFFCVWCRIWFLICFWQDLDSSVTKYLVGNPLISVTDLKLSPRLRSDFALSPHCFVSYHFKFLLFLI